MSVSHIFDTLNPNLAFFKAENSLYASSDRSKLTKILENSPQIGMFYLELERFLESQAKSD